jgi:tetratricopeptide (TPR) repeat protein
MRTSRAVALVGWMLLAAPAAAQDVLTAGLARADSLFRAGRYAQAVAQFDTVLARDPASRPAALGRAVALGYWGRYAEADAAYRAWVTAHPADTAAILDRARVLSWAGRLDASLALYEQYGGSAEADKGVARVRSWQGDLEGGEVRWAALTTRYPQDPEVWVGLGQVRRWLGRPRAAREALQQALVVDPAYEDARQQLRWVDAELRPMVGVDVTASEDSDGNALLGVTTQTGLSLPWGRRPTLSWAQRRASIRDLDTRADVLRAAWALQSASGRLTVAGDVGAARLVADATPRTPARETTRGLGSVRGIAQVGDRLTLSAGPSWTPFDEVASTIRSAVRLDQLDADATLRLSGQLSLGAAGGLGRVVGGTNGDNDRWQSSGTLRWTPSRAIGLAARARAFGHERFAADGYFSPRRLQLNELVLTYDRPRDLGLIWNGVATVGTQRVRLEDGGVAPVETTAWSLGATLAYRSRPGRELYLRAALANVASPGTVLDASDYRFGALSVGGRWLF